MSTPTYTKPHPLYTCLYLKLRSAAGINTSFGWKQEIYVHTHLYQTTPTILVCIALKKAWTLGRNVSDEYREGFCIYKV